MDFLVYVEHDAENLQFYLWYKDYVRRFEALSDHEKKLSREWVPESTELTTFVKDPEKNEGRKRKTTMNMHELNGYNEMADFDGDLKLKDNLSPSISLRAGSAVSSSINSPTAPSMVSSSTARYLEEAPGQRGLKWQPCTFVFGEQ